MCPPSSNSQPSSSGLLSEMAAQSFVFVALAALLVLSHAAPAEDQKEADSALEAVAAAAPQDTKDLETSNTYGLGYGLGYPGHGHLGYGLGPKVVAAPVGLGYGGLGYGGLGYGAGLGYGKSYAVPAYGGYGHPLAAYGGLGYGGALGYGGLGYGGLGYAGLGGGHYALGGYPHYG